MLHSLYVKNLALIDEIRVEFQDGLNILTGETGAGKSIILGSVNLALGGRYSSDMLRDEAAPGYVELTFFVENESQAALLREMDVIPEDGMVALSRKLIGRRSVSRINGESVTAAQLKEAAAVLIDIHGQHEHQSLLYKKHHLQILDTFAKEEIQGEKEQVSKLYHTYRQYSRELDDAKPDGMNRLKECSFLEFEIKEIEEANLKDGEDETLEEQYRRMQNAKRIMEGVGEAYGYTGVGQNSASDLLSRAIRCLQDSARFDERAQSLCDQLSDVDSLLSDANRELAEYRESLEFSPEAFCEVEGRLNEINRLKAKYGNTLSEIFAYRREREERLSKLRNYDSYLDDLRKKKEAAGRELSDAAARLSALRKEAAGELEKLIRDNLSDLNFLDVQFAIVFENMPEAAANGQDDVEFMISMNPGEPLRPLQDVASGGELSRIMLAIKTVMAKKDQIETLIFDEIDVGISGRTAQKVSEKMALIGKNHQVICITHLAQIAAMADAHYAIEKKVADGKTRTSILKLDKEQEISELARLLGGAQITDTVRKSAAEMKELANRTKKNQD